MIAAIKHDLGEVLMIYLALCDGEEPSLAVLKKRVDALLREHGIHAEITGYSQSRLLQYEIEEGKYFDLVKRIGFGKFCVY